MKKVDKILKDNSVHFDELGIVTGKNIELSDKIILSVDDLIKSYKTWLRKYMTN